MANLKADGRLFDANLVVETGVTITAGSLIFRDASGTSVVHQVRPYSSTTAEVIAHTGRGHVSQDIQYSPTGIFLGVIAKTQTGASTGVTWYTEGVFQFNTTPTASSAMRVGFPVYATRHDTVRAATSGVTTVVNGQNSTGINPIGICLSILGAGLPLASGSGGVVNVRLLPHGTIERSI